MDNDNEVKEMLKALFIECSEFSERVQEPPPSWQNFLSSCLINSDFKSIITLPLKVIGYFYSSLCSKFFQRSCQQAISDRLKIYVSHIRKKVAMGVPGYESILSVYDSFIGEYRAENKFFVKPLLFFMPYLILTYITGNNNLFIVLLKFFDAKGDFLTAITSGLIPYTFGITLFIYSLLYGLIYCVLRDIESKYMMRMLKLYKTHSLFDAIYMLYGKHQVKVIQEGKSSALEQIEKDLDRRLQINRRRSTDSRFVVEIYLAFILFVLFIILPALLYLLLLSVHNRFLIIENLPLLATCFACCLLAQGYAVLNFRNAIIDLKMRRVKEDKLKLIREGLRIDF